MWVAVSIYENEMDSAVIVNSREDAIEVARRWMLDDLQNAIATPGLVSSGLEPIMSTLSSLGTEKAWRVIQENLSDEWFIYIGEAQSLVREVVSS